ncbi:MAG: hypothetical protein AB1861_29645 [Cyanobacteriota bacterium]
MISTVSPAGMLQWIVGKRSKSWYDLKEPDSPDPEGVGGNTEAKTFNARPFEQTFTHHTAEVNGIHLHYVMGDPEPSPQKAIATLADVPMHTQFDCYRHLYFRTNDVDEMLAELNRRGVPTFAPAYDYLPFNIALPSYWITTAT